MCTVAGKRRSAGISDGRLRRPSVYDRVRQERRECACDEIARARRSQRPAWTSDGCCSGGGVPRPRRPSRDERDRDPYYAATTTTTGCATIIVTGTTSLWRFNGIPYTYRPSNPTAAVVCLREGRGRPAGRLGSARLDDRIISRTCDGGGTQPVLRCGRVTALRLRCTRTRTKISCGSTTHLVQSCETSTVYREIVMLFQLISLHRNTRNYYRRVKLFDFISKYLWWYEIVVTWKNALSRKCRIKAVIVFNSL